jgi:hypothetical protein
VPASGAPSILDKSCTITAEVTIAEVGAEGMIVTQGGRFGGYGLFLSKGDLGIDRGKVVFLYNLLDLKRTIWEGPDLKAGKHIIVFDFKSEGRVGSAKNNAPATALGARAASRRAGCGRHMRLPAKTHRLTPARAVQNPGRECGTVSPHSDQGLITALPIGGHCGGDRSVLRSRAVSLGQTGAGPQHDTAPRSRG